MLKEKKKVLWSLHRQSTTDLKVQSIFPFLRKVESQHYQSFGNKWIIIVEISQTQKKEISKTLFIYGKQT